MEKDINLQIEEFRQTIIDTVNRSGLPISVAYYILKDVFNTVESDYYAYLNDAAKKQRAEAEALAESAVVETDKVEEVED